MNSLMKVTISIAPKFSPKQFLCVMSHLSAMPKCNQNNSFSRSFHFPVLFDNLDSFQRILKFQTAKWISSEHRFSNKIANFSLNYGCKKIVNMTQHTKQLLWQEFWCNYFSEIVTFIGLV